jgi:2-polyprenyl-3-methyl-5-hydroxy-6-metoxy-1,4-benzoquinol methylase
MQTSNRLKNGEQVIEMSPNGTTKSKRKSIKSPGPKTKIREQRKIKIDATNKMLYDVARDEWMLSFWIDDKGIGNIQLPPDLSSLLQSETVSVSPSGGGIFIRSI